MNVGPSVTLAETGGIDWTRIEKVETSVIYCVPKWAPISLPKALKKPKQILRQVRIGPIEDSERSGFVMYAWPDGSEFLINREIQDPGSLIALYGQARKFLEQHCRRIWTATPLNHRPL
jgi:hypothetical protein